MLPKTCWQHAPVVTLDDDIVGRPCEPFDGTCGEGECALTINAFEYATGGYCTSTCETDAQCGAGGSCYRNTIEEYFESEGMCLLACHGSDADCRDGLVCRSSEVLGGSGTWCLPPQPMAAQ